MSSRVPTGYLVDVETNERIEFFAWNPFTNQVSPQYQIDQIRGRSTPQVGYVSTEQDTWSVSVVLSTDARVTDPACDTRSLMDKVMFVKSFCYPDYGTVDAKVVKPPHRLMLLRGDLRLVGGITGFSYTERLPYDVTGLPMVCDVSFTLFVLPRKPLSLIDVRQWWAA